MTFLIIAELTYSLTYQIIVLPIPSIPDFVYTHFAQKNSLNCQCMFTCDNVRMRSDRRCKGISRVKIVVDFIQPEKLMQDINFLLLQQVYVESRNF